MGYVTHTTTEQFVDGEPISTETLHFESYEDFKDWEKNQKVSSTAEELANHIDNTWAKKMEEGVKYVQNTPEWIEHTPKEYSGCPVAPRMKTEVMFRNGVKSMQYRADLWEWSTIPDDPESEIIKYRIV